MRYAIYLDDVQIEIFNSDLLSAIKKYEEEKEMYLNEDIYDKIELIGMEVVKSDSL